jgi:DNA helicase II / ATP-dependent DNA helicase PcrA
MKLPPESALSREQKEVMNAPTEGTILIVGPPGSGKTVVAVLRERALKKRRETVTSVVFTNVLTRYTGNKLTFDSWLYTWWRTATGSDFPVEWIVDPDNENERARVKNFVRATELATNHLKEKLKTNGHWGHLILDEAQDFPPEAHRLLFQVQQKVFALLPEDERPSICILADENQRITSTNSTIKQIRASYPFLSDDDEYALTRNYRNSKPIAEFAAHFYVGLASGIPELPTIAGDKPRVFVANLDSSVDRIVTYAKNHPNEEIGVLVQYNPTRKKVYNKLEHRLKGTAISVQTYGTKPKEHRDASKLTFDMPGTVTVLCFASAKGLEFDAVFLPELQTLRLEGGERDQARMALYVMCSRARKQLLLSIDDASGVHEIWKMLPAKDLWVGE